MEDSHAIVLVAGAIFLGNFLSGFFNAEAKGIALRNWIRKRFRTSEN